MKTLKEFFRIRERIFRYFGYKEDWVTIPLDDHTDDYWYYDGNDHDGTVFYYDEPFTVEGVTSGEKLYSGTLYTQRFLPRWIYRKKRYTMICVDTHCDGNKFLMVFDNKKELKNPSPEMRKAFGLWGGF